MKHYRLKQTAALPRQTDGSVADIAAQVGYESPGKSTRAFREQLGVLPKDCRR